jgi:hypothetical protein
MGAATPPAAQAALDGLANLRATEDPQDQATVAVVAAFTAAARGQPDAAPSGWAARRCSTARTPSSPTAPAPRPRDDGIR